MTGQAWAGTLALGSGLVVYDGPGASAQRHRHDAVQLVIGVDGPIEVHFEWGAAVVGVTVVPSRAVHELSASGRTVVVLVEPFGSVGAAISGFAERHAGTELSGRLGPLAAPPIGDSGEAVAWSRSVLSHLAGTSGVVELASVRPEVQRLVGYVDDHLAGTPRLGDIAAQIGLSPRQLRRAVAADVGMPFRRYVLWRRLRRAVLDVQGGRDLTTAAATAGFADSAHFSRVFRAMFGLTPSEVLPVLDIVNVEFDIST